MKPKKMKHNKKRNTAFLFEILIKELTKSSIKKSPITKEKITLVLKESFNNQTELAKELDLYRSLYETSDMDKEVAEKIMREARRKYDSLDREQIFLEQNRLISSINKVLSPHVFSNFVPNYKTLASIFQIFNEKTPVKQKVLLETVILEKLTSGEEKESDLKPIDNLVYKSFVKNFNQSYNDHLLMEQKELLQKYITSFADDGIEFKIFLNEELGRLRSVLAESFSMQEIKEDEVITSKIEKIHEIINNFKDHEINLEMIDNVVKIQQLVSEIKK